MRLYPSTSIRQLVLVSFSLVTLPLVLALAFALFSIDRSTTQGRQAIFAATSTIKASRMLVEDLTAMERYARQYQVLKDESLARAHLERHQSFRGNVQTLLRQPITEPLHAELVALMTEESAVFETLREARGASPKVAFALDQFRSLSARARALLDDGSQLVWQEAEHIQQAAIGTQRLLLWMAVLLVALACILAVVCTALITRPIRQVNQAIRRLGDGDFSHVIRVVGPDDLESVGNRLEWLRRRLIELERQKVTFMQHISHELKTPLASIREGAGLLKDEVVGPLNPEQAEVARILQRNSLQLQRLIEDLISFSVVQRPAPAPERRAVQLDRVLSRLAEEQKLAAKAKHIALDLRAADVCVMGDEEKLRVIFDNLLSNAIKYTPPYGKISIGLRADAGRAVVDVRDNGPGIDPNERAKVFDAFYQGRAVAKGHIKGTGLGLSIAREYVRMHGGHIEALACTDGAHMRVVLPLAAPLACAPDDAAPVESLAS